MLNPTLRAPSRALALCAALVFATSCGLDDKPNCGPGEVLCGNACVDVSNDPAHCGACETTCDEASVCDLGRCSATCTSGTDACDGVCRDLDTDLANCGACGIACGTDEVCSAGLCGAECTGGLEACDGVCRDLRADPLHCGACGTSCAADQVCTDGLCAPTCATALADCGGACRDLETDADHCGACGMGCAANQVCSEGACADVCADGLTACDADCVDLAADPRHCGDCVTACALGEDCSVGVCGDTEDPPVFISTPVVTVDEDVLYTYAIVANDLDGNSTISLTASTRPAWLSIVDNGDGTATLSGTPTQAEIGVHAVVLVASDGTTSVEQTFDVTVVAIDDAPVFVTSPVLTGGDDVVYTYLVEVTDEEGAVVTVTATTLPTWLAFTDNGDGTYTLAGTPTDAEIGDHDVVLEASDGMLTTLQSFTVTISDVNDLPVFTSMEVLTATEDVAYTYDVTTTDTDVGATLALSAPTLPSWLVFTDNGDGTGTLSGTPTNANVGNHDVELVVTDGSAMVSQSFTIVVTNTNDAPTFTSIAVLTATEDAPYAYAIATDDVDLMDTLAISAGGLPGWLSLTDGGDGTATLSGTPANDDVGSVGVTLTVIDVAGETGTQTFTIVVTPVNDPPAFTSTPVTSGTQDVAYAYAITATDEESAPLTILATVRPAWLAFTDDGNGTASLSGTPGSADIGTHDVTLTVSDGVTTITQTFQIVVGDVNDAPEFTSTPITAATEDALYTYAIVTSDADAGAMLTISQTVLPAWLTFTDNGDGTATLSGTPTNAHVGSHPVTLGVSDGTLSATQMFTIVVTNTNDAPTFTSSAPTSATQNALYAYAITTTDPDVGAVLDITSTTLPAWLTFVDAGDGTATLSGTPGPTDVANVDVTLTVTDGTASVTQVFTIVVGDVNDAPSFTSIPITTATEDTLYSYAITTTDPDAGATLVISATTLPGWLTFVDNGNGTASLTGTPINAEVGSHAVVLRVTDGTTPVTQTFAIVVTNTNDAPSFTSAAVTAATEDAPYTYTITTTDPDVGATLTLTAPTLPAWLAFTPGANGGGTLSGTPSNANVGTHAVVLSVTDGTASIQQSFTITVTNTNDAPTFTSTAPTSVFAANLYSYAITTADVDVGDTRTITSSALPTWLMLTDNGDGTATLSGTPAVSDAGTVNVTLTVNDGDATATQVFTITVNTQPPVAIAHSYNVVGNTELVVESVGTKLAVPRGNVFSTSTNDLLVGATDPDTNPATLTAALGTGPSSGSLVLSADGSFSYAPNAGFAGTDSFTFTLSDGTNTSNAATVTLSVASRVWYVNNLTNADNAGAKNPVGGNGTSIDAFDTLAAFEAVVSFAGDVIFIAAGDSAYDALDADGLDLLPSQAVIGQAANLIVSGTPLSVGNALLRPTIVGSAGPAISLSSANTVSGVALVTTTNICLRSVGGAGGTVVDVTMTTGSAGTGISLASHTGAFAFSTGSITGTLGTSVGVSITGATAPTVALTNLAIMNVRLGVAMNGTTADVSFNGGGIANTTGGRAIDVVAAASGGSLVFSAGASVTATGIPVGDGISIAAGGHVFDLTMQNVTLSGVAGSDDAIALSGFGTGSTVSFAGVTTLSGFGGDGLDLFGATPTSNDGTFTFADFSTTTIAGTDVLVANGRPNLTVHVRSGTGITNTVGRSVSVTGTSGATVLFDTGAISDTAGGLDISGNANSTITFDSAVTVTPAATNVGVLATANTGSAIRFGTLAVTTSGAIGISAGPAASLNVTSGTLSTTNALGLSLASITSGTVTMVGTTVNNNAGGGVAITGCGGTINLGATAITNTNGVGISMTTGGTLQTTSGSVTTTTGRAIALDTVAANVVLGRVASTSSPTEGVRLNAVTGSFTVNDSMVGTTNDLDVNLAATNAIAVSASAVAFNASSIDIDGSSGSGILLTSNTGSITVGSGDVATSAGTEVAVTGGTATITLGSSITNTTGKALTIASTTGGTITMTGGIVCDGTGVTFSNNTGGSISLSGTLDVDTTTNTAFDITANTSSVTLAGTLDVQTTSGRGINVVGVGASSTFTVTGSANVVASTTGIAVSIVSSSIGAANATFRSISANGAQNGIVLSSTGSLGDFFVTGVGATFGSGGLLNATTGSAILLTNVSGVHLSNLDITAPGASGIESTTGTVDDLDLTNVRITNAGNAVNEGGIYITSNLTGPCSITGTTITGSAENNVEMVQTSGTLTLTVGTSTFSQNSTALGANGFLLETRGSAIATAIFTGTTFSQNAVTHLRANAIDMSDLTVNVATSTFTATPANDTINGIVLTNGDSADLTFDVDNNTFAGPTSVSNFTAHTALYVVSADTGTINAPINGYFRNNANISNQNFGVVVDVRNNAPHALAIANNTFGSVRTRAIDYISGVHAGDASAGHLTITGNSCSATAIGADRCAFITPTQSSTLCTNVRQNVFTANVAAIGMFVTAPATMRIESSGTDCGGVCANATAHLDARNTLTPGASTTGVTLAAPTTCALPTL